MNEWSAALARGLRSGTVASLLSSAALVATGWWWKRRPAAPSNGPSQWLWGPRGAREARFTWRNTVTGYVIHHAMSVFWASLHEGLLADPRDDGPLRAAKGLATAAIAAFVDYRVVPERLQPGFDKHLPTPLVAVVYVAFAAGLALGPGNARRPRAMGSTHGGHGPSIGAILCRAWARRARRQRTARRADSAPRDAART